MLSLDEVLAALPPSLQKVFADERVTELMINSPDSVFYERGGCLFPVNTGNLTKEDIEATALRIARRGPEGRDADKSDPIVDARLPDGSRVAIACPPVTETYAFSIRRFGRRPWTAQKLVESGSLPVEVRRLTEQALSRRENILISGGTGTGKTTLLSALASLISEDERIVSIEDTRELQIPAPNCLRLEARGGNVTIRDLVRHALRHRPDRLIVGEVRGAEAKDLIQALNTGHGGSISTIHANSARAALTRLATCALQDDSSLTWHVVCELVALAVQYVIHLERSSDGRRSVEQVLRVNGYSQARERFDCTLVVPADGGGVVEEAAAEESSQEPAAEPDGGERKRMLLCTGCGGEFAVGNRGPRSPLCKKCRKREQNRRAYERRVAQGVNGRAG